MAAASNASSNVTDALCGFDGHQWLEAKFVLISVCGTLVTAFGIFGNLTTALILTRPSMRSPNNLFLTALAVFDTCLLLTAFLIYAMEYIIEYTRSYNLYIAWLTYLRFVFALSHISQTGSVYTTVAVTVERFLAVVFPRYGKRACTKHSAALSVLIVTCFAILFNCTKFFELDVMRNQDCPIGSWQAYVLYQGDIVKYEGYGTVYTLYMTNIVMVFLPFLLLLAGNSLIAFTIRKSMQRLRWAERISRHSELKEKSRDATRVLVVIVFIFLVCNFWGFVLAVLERTVGIFTLATKYQKFYAFSRESINFLAIVNSSINFVIYCIFGKDFRKELVVVYGCGGRGVSLMLPVHDKFAVFHRRQGSAGQRRTDAGPDRSSPPDDDYGGAAETAARRRSRFANRDHSSPTFDNFAMNDFSVALANSNDDEEQSPRDSAQTLGGGGRPAVLLRVPDDDGGGRAGQNQSNGDVRRHAEKAVDSLLRNGGGDERRQALSADAGDRGDVSPCTAMQQQLNHILPGRGDRTAHLHKVNAMAAMCDAAAHRRQQQQQHNHHQHHHQQLQHRQQQRAHASAPRPPAAAPTMTTITVDKPSAPLATPDSLGPSSSLTATEAPSVPPVVEPAPTGDTTDCTSSDECDPDERDDLILFV